MDEQNIRSELEASQQTVKFYEMLFRTSPDGIVLIDAMQNIILANYTFSGYFGRRTRDLVETSIHTWIEQLDGDAKKSWAELEGRVRTGAVYRGKEFRMATKEGMRHFVVNASLLDTVAKEEKGTIISFWRDVTKHKQAEEKLRDAEARLKNTFNISPGLICAADANTGYFTECNPAVTRILGFSVEEFTSTPFMELIHPDDRQRTADQIAKQLRGSPVVNLRNRYRCKDGSYKWLAWQATAAEKSGKVHAVATDITDLIQAEEELRKQRDLLEELVAERTAELAEVNDQLRQDISERKRVQKALRESEERYKEMFSHTKDGVAVYEAVNYGEDFIFVDFNRSAEKIDKVRRDELIGKKITDKFPSVIDFGLFEVFQRVWATGKPEQHSFIRYKDERISGWRDNFVYKLPSEEIVSVYSDETESKQAVEALRTSQEYTKNVIDSSMDMIITANKDREIVEFNKAAEETFGYSREEVVGKLADILYADTTEGLAVHNTTIEQGRSAQEVLNRRKDGEVFPSFLSASILRDPYGETVGLMGVSRDITESKLADEQIKASLKEKEVLLKEIHHRVKNNLQVISSLLDMKVIREDNQQVIDVFEDTRSKIQTMALIHSHLYESERFDQINMGNYVRELLEYLSKIFESKFLSITPSIEHSDVQLSIIQAVPCAFVLNELISNAFKHAFKEGETGTIEISILKKDHDTVVLKVKDDGMGIPEEIDVLKTDSLGLKLMRNTVQDQLMGKIDFERAAGTTITVEFKMFEEEENHV